jgi:sigma-B regulation protein RsbU (phosphoserine phosphatase)
MIPAPIPENEEERLAELYALDILDTPGEERFDRLVELSSLAFRVPIAYVSMVDVNRQWFKAQCGLSVSQTGRAESFCGHAIAADELLVIPDARADPRFFDNPLVVAPPFVRFYAGCPLHGPCGRAIGTLCLVDREPRTLSDEELRLLEKLAGLVERELNLVDLIRMQRQLLETKSALVEAREQLARELADAEKYMRSLLPATFANDHIRTDWKLVCSSQLGGDMLGYRWIDDDHLALWVLDVCGHGVGSSLLSISAHDTLRGLRLEGVDPRRPSDVLAALNRAFPMELHQYKFFTAWYGVYSQAQRTLRYASAAHPPALAFEPGREEPLRLGASAGTLIGAVADSAFESESRRMPPGSRLYVFTDGAFEVPGANGGLLGIDGLARFLAAADGGADGKSSVERAFAAVTGGSAELEDDFTLLEVEFL